MHDRKLRRPDLQRRGWAGSPWVDRRPATTTLAGHSYGALIAGLKRNNIELDRKILADLAVRDSGTFGQIVELARSA